MLTRDLLKEKIDKVQEGHLAALYNIIKVFESPNETLVNISNIEASISAKDENSDWNDFIEETYGCLRDDPVKRGDQGEYEVREAIKWAIYLIRTPVSNI